MDRDEEKLLDLLRKGKESAYRQLFDKHYVIMCKVAYGFLRDHFLAKSVVNDVIVYIWENRQHIEIRTSLRSYLLGAVRYSCMNYLQKKHVQREVSISRIEDERYFMQLSDDYPLGTLLEKELEEKITQAVNHLPDECRQVFRLSRFENLSYEEISQKLSISVNTVKYHIKNAISKLRENLDKYLIVGSLIINNLFL